MLGARDKLEQLGGHWRDMIEKMRDDINQLEQKVGSYSREICWSKRLKATAERYF